jgi:hypothetical protein
MQAKQDGLVQAFGAQNTDGKPAMAVPGPGNSKALAIAMGALGTIPATWKESKRDNSPAALLNGQKVRDFTNNGRDPSNPNSVTCDSIQTGVALGMACASGSKTYAALMKSTTAAKSINTDNCYSAVADAVRDATAAFNAAHNVNLVPSQVQATTWVVMHRIGDTLPKAP